MAYCTDADVRVITNISTADIDAAAMSDLIATADRRCNSRITAAGIDLPIPTPYPDSLRDASAYYTAAACLNRKRIDLSRPNNLSLEGLSFGVSPEAEIAYLEIRADAFLSKFISDSKGGSSSLIVVVEGD